MDMELEEGTEIPGSGGEGNWKLYITSTLSPPVVGKLRNCVEVEVDVLGSPSLIAGEVSGDVGEATLND